MLILKWMSGRVQGKVLISNALKRPLSRHRDVILTLFLNVSEVAVTGMLMLSLFMVKTVR